MADWQERITRDTKPSIRVEHDLRYAAAAPFVAGAPTWCDLGCGTGVAAADALGDTQLARVVLVDADADALDQAGRDLQARDVVRVQADLATDEGVAAVRAALGDGEPGAITCFEVIEHLLGDEVELFLTGARRAIRPTGRVVISVPIMQGPVLPLKVISGALLHRHLPEYSLAQLLRGTLGLSVPRVAGSRHSHRGFDFRELRKQILRVFDIKEEFYSPFKALPWQANSQAFFVCRPKT